LNTITQESVEEIQCKECKKLKSEAGIIRFREGFNKYLCSNCCYRALGDYDKICCKCGINNADGSFEMKQYNGKDMCADCIEKELLKREHIEAIKIRIKNFTKDNWKFLINTGIAIIFGIIGISLI